MTDVCPGEASGIGTTGDDYTSHNIDVRERKYLTIHLKNTDLANTLTYNVDGYANYGGSIPKSEATADVLPGVTVQILVTKKLAQVTVQVKSKVASTPATYAYEAIAAVF
jgi:hypothetical protein